MLDVATVCDHPSVTVPIGLDTFSTVAMNNMETSVELRYEYDVWKSWPGRAVRRYDEKQKLMMTPQRFFRQDKRCVDALGLQMDLLTCTNSPAFCISFSTEYIMYYDFAKRDVMMSLCALVVSDKPLSSMVDMQSTWSIDINHRGLCLLREGTRVPYYYEDELRLMSRGNNTISFNTRMFESVTGTKAQYEYIKKAISLFGKNIYSSTYGLDYKSIHVYALSGVIYKEIKDVQAFLYYFAQIVSRANLGVIREKVPYIMTLYDAIMTNGTMRRVLDMYTMSVM